MLPSPAPVSNGAKTAKCFISARPPIAVGTCLFNMLMVALRMSP